MKKYIQLLFFIFLSAISFSQVKKDTTMSKIALGFNISSIYKISSGENGDWKYGICFLAQLDFKRKFDFKIGLCYDLLRDHTNISLDYYNTILHRKNEHQYSFLNIPATLCFQLRKSRLNLFVEAGLQGSILMQNEFTSDDEIFHTKEKLFNNGSFIAFSDIGIGVSYKINSKLDFIFNISYYMSFIPLVWDYTNQIGETILEKVYLNYYKGSFGVVYHFNKL